MPDLLSRLRDSIDNFDGPLWFPHLSNELASHGWHAINEHCGLNKSSYSTSRVLYGNHHAPCVIVAALSPLRGEANNCLSSIRIELLEDDVASRFKDEGVSFYSAEEIAGHTVFNCLLEAMEILEVVPSILATVASFVRNLHILKPTDDDHDISFTEPAIPFSAFISVPLTSQSNSALRVAEAMLHEAMHLQLTLLERLVPFCSQDGNGFYYSPWRNQFRSANGIVHALYVFRVIDQFFELLRPCSTTVEISGEYVTQRRKQIAKQIKSFTEFHHNPELTPEGAKFVQRLVQI